MTPRPITGLSLCGQGIPWAYPGWIIVSTFTFIRFTVVTSAITFPPYDDVCVLCATARKTQTTKDLYKVWSQLPPVSGHDDMATEEKSTPSNGSVSETNLLRHSAMTTLLLDDSPQKAHLQPWNHVCLREYDAATRNQDLKALLDTGQKMETGHVDGRTSVDEPQTDETSSSIVPPRTTESARPTAQFQDSFDPTLLAIIGILEAIKHESNVAGWIRAHGLWVEGHPDTLTNHIPQQMNKTESHSTHPYVSGTKRPRDHDEDDALDTHAKQGPVKRPRLHTLPHPVMENSTIVSQLSDPPSSPFVELSQACAPPIEMDAKHWLEKDVAKAVHHISSEDEKNVSREIPTFWFSHAPAFAHWIIRGREALARLGIHENHGVSAEEA
jgi:hypothetical protein